MMKRSKRDGDASSMEEMADTLMLLSTVGSEMGSGRRVFTCKTCNREFPSFQALGGHRASHKKPRIDFLGAKVVEGLGLRDHGDEAAKKPKSHECSICGQEFQIGQALGGHMRRHRGEINGRGMQVVTTPVVPLLKKSLSSKRVLCLDLNLSPFENDLRLMLGKVAPPI